MADAEAEPATPPWWRRLVDTLKVPVLATFSALVLGGVVIMFTHEDGASLSIVVEAYTALFQGALGSPAAISETLLRATPLILAGLAVGFAFKAALFNIGANGQMIMGAIAAAWAGFTLDIPGPLALVVAMLCGVLGGAIWGGIAGVLKATTGAHEVITTIMLNFIATFFVAYVLTTRTFLPGDAGNPVSKKMLEQARLPRFIDGERVDAGILIALAAVFLVWWLLERSTFGFQVKAVGLNPDAARYAGMNVALITALTMAIAGGLAGLGGGTIVIGPTGVLTAGAIGTLGFDAIAVALLGRSNPLGILAAGLLFGGLNAGAVRMQVETQIPVDIVIVIQALIILFVAAPALVRAIYRIKAEPTDTPTFTSSWGG
ncbi:MAG: ABC transporter permease [Actinomycetia bacterium]|nr:ABC transporter permease [Actinomycetes bacterium]